MLCLCATVTQGVRSLVSVIKVTGGVSCRVFRPRPRLKAERPGGVRSICRRYCHCATDPRHPLLTANRATFTPTTEW